MDGVYIFKEYQDIVDNLCIDKNKWQNESGLVNKAKILFCTLITCCHGQITTKISPIRYPLHHRECFPQPNYILSDIRRTWLVSLLFIYWFRSFKRLAKFKTTRFLISFWSVNLPQPISVPQKILSYHIHTWCNSPRPPSLDRTFGQSSWLYFPTLKSILHPIKLLLFLLLFLSSFIILAHIIHLYFLFMRDLLCRPSWPKTNKIPL